MISTLIIVLTGLGVVTVVLGFMMAIGIDFLDKHEYPKETEDE